VFLSWFWVQNSRKQTPVQKAFGAAQNPQTVDPKGPAAPGRIRGEGAESEKREKKTPCQEVPRKKVFWAQNKKKHGFFRKNRSQIRQFSPKPILAGERRQIDATKFAVFGNILAAKQIGNGTNHAISRVPDIHPVQTLRLHVQKCVEYGKYPPQISLFWYKKYCQKYKKWKQKWTKS